MKLNLTPTHRCPACQQPYGNLKATYSLEKFNIYDCPSCKLRFIDPSLTAEQQMHIYQDSQELRQVNSACSNYYEYDILNPQTQTYRDYVRALVALEKIMSERTLCEIGCGTGKFLKLAQTRGWNVTGIDSSVENIKALQAAGMNAICNDVFSVVVPSSRFDVVVLWDVLEHPQKPAELLKKCQLLLKQDGILLVASPCYPNLLSIVAGILSHLSAGKIKAPLEQMYVLEHTSYFSLNILRPLLSSCCMRIVGFWKTETDLQRYFFKGFVRFFLKVAFLAARLFNLQNRFIALVKND